jgi:hypothetical protein
LNAGGTGAFPDLVQKERVYRTSRTEVKKKRKLQQSARLNDQGAKGTVYLLGKPSFRKLYSLRAFESAMDLFAMGF